MPKSTRPASTHTKTIAALIATLVLLLPKAHAQSPPTQLNFEVASVKQNKSDGKSSMNVDPTNSDVLTPTGGLYSAKNIVLVQYIAFAYKLTNKQLQSVVAQVPWTTEDRFDIEARAAGDPTKDQYRQMMQSLLADRFHLTVHFETRQVDIFALVLAKPGKLGPQLRLHQPDDPVCSNPQAPVKGQFPAAPDGFPAYCGSQVRMQPSAPGRMKSGGRDVSMARFAAIVPNGVGAIDRPVTDQTGLKQNMDFTLEWIQVAANVPPGADFHPDESAPSFQEALKEQLGLKLLPQKGPAEFFLIDHIEHPSPN